MEEALKAAKHAAHPHVHYTVIDSLTRYAETLGYGDIHMKLDEATGLKAIVAINNLKRGPAIGGCRLAVYHTLDRALEDALRLGYMMSYKAAITNLPHGGAKAVIVQPKVIKNREAFFEKFGEFVNELGGRYITAVDSGTSTHDMDSIAKKTPFVTCTSRTGSDSDPSPFTALGVIRGMEAAVKYKMQRSSLEGIRVAIQGAGHVGYHLAKELIERKANVIMSDINQQALQACVDKLHVDTCSPEEIFSVNADVFAPCALGAVLNKETINRLKTKVIAGSANNQLAHHHYAALLQERGILYAPDFLINSGGLIQVAVSYSQGSKQEILKRIDEIYHTSYEIFERSEKEHLPTNDVAEKIARERLR